jgi:predicted transcriptional regulator
MLEEQIKKIMQQKNITAIDIYKPLKIHRINFYKALKTSNLKNKSLEKIINFLGFSIVVNLKQKENENKKRVL